MEASFIQDEEGPQETMAREPFQRITAFRRPPDHPVCTVRSKALLLADRLAAREESTESTHHAQSSPADVTAANANTVTRSADLATKMCTTSRCSSGYRRSERVTGSCHALVTLWREGVDLWVHVPSRRSLVDHPSLRAPLSRSCSDGQAWWQEGCDATGVTRDARGRR